MGTSKTLVKTVNKKAGLPAFFIVVLNKFY